MFFMYTTARGRARKLAERRTKSLTWKLYLVVIYTRLRVQIFCDIFHFFCNIFSSCRSIEVFRAKKWTMLFFVCRSFIRLLPTNAHKRGNKTVRGERREREKCLAVVSLRSRTYFSSGNRGESLAIVHSREEGRIYSSSIYNALWCRSHCLNK